MRIAYRGNHSVPHSTESHVSASIEALGHEVVRIQENERSWPDTVAMTDGADLFLWTSTYGFACSWPKESAIEALGKIGAAMPTVGMHLDLWFGLGRERMVYEEPFFQHLQFVFTADGDHDAEFAAAGVNHRWLPPAVYRAECTPGRRRSIYSTDVAFVGSWQGYGHAEWWPHRKALLDFLRGRYGRRFRCWPQPGRPAVRGAALNDLYASVSVVVGDSAMCDRSRLYWSDRAPETIGRGGFLVFPYIAGLAEQVIGGEHCAYYPPGNFDQLGRVIDHYLDDAHERERIRAAGQAHVAAEHSYENRVQEVLDVLCAEGALPCETGEVAA